MPNYWVSKTNIQTEVILFVFVTNRNAYAHAGTQFRKVQIVTKNSEVNYYFQHITTPLVIWMVWAPQYKKQIDNK